VLIGILGLIGWPVTRSSASSMNSLELIVMPAGSMRHQIELNHIRRGKRNQLPASRLPASLPRSGYYEGMCSTCGEHEIGLRSEGMNVICLACACSMEKGPFSVDQARQREEELHFMWALNEARALLVSTPGTLVKNLPSESPSLKRKEREGEDLADIEKERRQNIARNRELLIELGLHPAGHLCVPPPKRQRTCARPTVPPEEFAKGIEKIAVLTTMERLPIVCLQMCPCA
jgi:hypothetical protein